MVHLCLDVSVGHDVANTTASRLDALAQDDGEVTVGGGLSGNVVGLVVLVGAGDGEAAGQGGLGLGGVHHDNAVGSLGVDDGRDIEEVNTSIAVEGELGEDARDVSLAVVVRVGVSSPT